MNESSEKGMEGNGSSGPGNGIPPVEWQNQFAGGFSAQQQQQHTHMMDSFAAAASGMWAAPSQNMSALSDVSGMSRGHGPGFLGPVPGAFLPPSCLGGHFPVDSGFIERAARSSCFAGPGAFGGGGDQHMGSAFGGVSEGYLDHRSSDKAEPEIAGNQGVPSSEAAGGDCSSKGSDSKKRRRPSEVLLLASDWNSFELHFISVRC